MGFADVGCRFRAKDDNEAVGNNVGRGFGAHGEGKKDLVSIGFW